MAVVAVAVTVLATVVVLLWQLLQILVVPFTVAATVRSLPLLLHI